MRGRNPAQDPVVLRFEYHALVVAHLLDVPLRFAAGGVVAAHAVFGPFLMQAYGWWDPAVRAAGLLAAFGLAGLTLDRRRVARAVPA